MNKVVIGSLFIVLFVSFTIVWNFSYQAGLKGAYVPLEKQEEYISILSEKGVFERAKFALDYAKMPVDEAHQRSLKNYYENRAYYGAPPSIPHAVSDERNMGSKACLKCHENGGYVENYQAYTPVTPHPEKTNCRQCHVVQKTKAVFEATRFEKNTAPKIGTNKALLSSPPTIPHQIQLRENCLACHAGPAAPKEIRVSHPERVNCRQCHVFDNKVLGAGIFVRK
jgi:cytochrome c-type protein NapB